MTDGFTIGIEEEFQMVARETGQLAPCIETIMEKGVPQFGEQIKPEMLQSTVEIISNVCPNIAAARLEMTDLRVRLARLVSEEGLALISAGTHPGAHWYEQVRTDHERYVELEEEFQDVGRSILIFGLHVHVGIESHEIAISLMNQLRTWLPHLLALSSNSPFWGDRMTGLKSYRTVVWKRFPRSGLPEVFPSWEDFDRYVQSLVATGCIDNGKKIWWDIRPHPFFSTIEFRIFDMPSTLDDTIALAALCQALVAKLTWLYKHGMEAHVLPRDYVDENKWRAMRYGLDAEVIDFVNHRRLSMRDSINEMLDFVDDVLDDLGTRREINYLRILLDDPRGTGADRQMAVWRETHDLRAVIDYLTARTMEGIPVDVAHRQRSV
ncbi:MAG: carboxylate-amine ligase [Ktedonobacteraceae bacterium]|nr:carboxylate-amine ligase [Ktedonobacteraceae bacterium]